MNNSQAKLQRRVKRHKRIRAKISGTAAIPRLSVFKSNKGMYVQLIDDTKFLTLASAHSREIKGKMKKMETAAELGKLLAAKAVEKKISAVVFDKSSYKYHGRVKALADGAREGGLVF